jgi:tetratricopeptide (TPR) repeat protein
MRPMKKVILTLVILFVSQFNFANESDSLLLDNARAASLEKDYDLAIKEYKKYIKLVDAEDLKNIYVEIANCYFFKNDKNQAIKYIKEAITKYGLTEEEAFIYSQVIEPELSKYALSILYYDLEKMQKKYILSLD